MENENRYDRRLKQIIEKYHMMQRPAGDSTMIHNILMELFKTRCSNKKTALWGAGRNNSENSHASVIVNKYATYVQSLICIIDSCEDFHGKEFMQLPIISPSQIQDNGIDIVIIASKYSASSIKEDLIKYAPKCEYLDIYEELKKRDIIVYHKFFDESSIYTQIYDAKQVYNNGEDQETKQNALKVLIGLYLCIKDFYYAEKYIKEYKYNNYDQSQNLIDMLDEIKLLLQEVKEVNSKRKEDITIYFIDSLRAMDVFEKNEGKLNFKMLKNYMENSAIFTNAYATGPTTYESMMGIIAKRNSFEKNAYENNFIFDYDEFDILKIAEEKSMDIRFYISEGYRVIRDNDKIKYKKQIYMTDKLWSVATDMAVADQPTFNFIYFPCELHFPLICGEHRNKPEIHGFVDVGVVDMSSFIEAQFDDCIHYVDNVLEYYRTFFSKEMLAVFFSDHSQVIYDKEEQKPFFTYYNNVDRSVHVTFFISSSRVEPKEYPELFSMIDFNILMSGVMKDRQVIIPDTKVVKYQYYNIHNKKLRQYAIERDLQNYIDGINCFMSDEYIYIITGTGREEVYDRKNRKQNIIATEKGRLFAEQIRTNYNIDFPDFLKIH
ncbi:MAG: hypothetical protein K0S01_3081 [Herbinix sp.]|jgi:hypothetical protein|nr:hypothetical protein [Herbinix sp.]